MYTVTVINWQALGVDSERSGRVDVHFASNDLGRLRLLSWGYSFKLRPHDPGQRVVIRGFDVLDRSA